ncbi:MAG TPA: RNA 2',3'-cyclic phosphodiesterase [Actinomycetota bacterium]|jgi:2'-5' RNA ligase|nr:RNA 2',3'-cyclic phosphodiesterase [Actinomycetota bacterium]
MGRDRAARPEAKPLRLFVAVDLPGHAEDLIERAVAPWKDRLPQGRWVARRKWHVTLKFLGRTFPRLVGAVEDACRQAAAAAAPFDMALDGLGVFPGRTRARVFWVGLDDPSGGMTALAADLDDRLAADFPPEKRAFTPHLTVARFNPPIPFHEHAEDVARAELRSDPFPMDRLLLYRSHLSPKGAEYEPVGEYELGR